MYSLDKIFSMLQKQKFADYYNQGEFMQWLSGENPDITEEQAKNELKKMLDSIRHID